MKTKIVKVRSAKTIQDKIAGIGLFRLTGPSPTGDRVVVEIMATREQVEKNVDRLLAGETL